MPESNPEIAKTPSFDRVHGDAREPRRLLVAADGIDMHGLASGAQSDRGDNHHRKPDHCRQRKETAGVAQRLEQRVADENTPFRDGEGKPACNTHHGERRDQRLHAADGHHDPVEETAAKADRHREQRRRHQTDRRVVRQHDRRQRHHRGHREVETAGDDDEELADRQNAEQRRLGQKVAEVAGGEEHRRGKRGDGADEKQDDEDVVSRNEGAEPSDGAAPVVNRRHAHAASPMRVPTA